MFHEPAFFINGMKNAGLSAAFAAPGERSGCWEKTDTRQARRFVSEMRAREGRGTSL